MAPEDRRAALIAATLPLLHEHGLDVSTRQIAQAAGVAEGTIFGVFPDKRSLLVAAITQAFDPTPTLEAIAAIDRRLDLRARLSAAATLIGNRFAGNARLLHAARLAHHAGDPEGVARMNRAREQLLAGLAALIEPDAGQLRREPAEVARLVLLFCGANTYGPFGDRRVDGDELVSLLLDGLLVVTDGTSEAVIPLIAARPDQTHGGV
ncbi:TetR/AcrR family transcriptional regulator [Actinoplanes sp. NPDC049599]|uniref:TetR/AcrR family transcriptional regulator n=1 Tax=Actinoplanes sp. NPDC049599 TaxID=3363903 RepID=UPI0037B973E4